MWKVGKINEAEKKPLTLSECLDREDYYSKPIAPWIMLLTIITLCLYNYLHLDYSEATTRLKIADVVQVSRESKTNTTQHLSVVLASFSSENNKSRQKIAILVPYRDRKSNLEVFLNYIHPFLKKQKLDYRIFVVEQFGTKKFNRGRLFNAGYKEIKKLGNWSCVIFHDVDLLPLDDRISYACPKWPLLLCSSIVGINEGTFRTLFGGVSVMSSQQFERVNGYSNWYWGWGGEDNDMYWRIRTVGYPILKYNKTIAQYKSLKHTSQVRNKLRYRLLNTAKTRMYSDGLSSITYHLKNIKLHDLYTHITVDIN